MLTQAPGAPAGRRLIQLIFGVGTEADEDIGVSCALGDELEPLVGIADGFERTDLASAPARDLEMASVRAFEDPRCDG